MYKLALSCHSIKEHLYTDTVGMMERNQLNIITCIVFTIINLTWLTDDVCKSWENPNTKGL